MAFTLDSLLVDIPLQALPVAAAVLDRNGTIVAANHQFERLCGWVDSTHSGRPLAEIVDESDRPAVEEALAALAFLDDRAPRRVRVKALRARLPSLWLAMDVARLGPESVFPYLVCLHAVARRRESDRPQRGIFQAHAARSEDAGADSGTSAVTADIDRWPPLLMTLSHEFRGPLTAIRGWAQMAEKGVLAPEKISRALNVIRRNAASLTDMIENLFDLSRRAAGSLVLKREIIDLNPLAQLVVESALPGARDRNVILTIRCRHAALLVNGDPFRLEQVVRNLVENAIKFTPTGGHVHVHTTCEGRFAALFVTDNGRGITPDLLPIIFEPFQHDDQAVRPSERGLGLGLTLVRELVRLHGGDVRALSGGRGQGSTFVVRLPLASTAVAA